MKYVLVLDVAKGKSMFMLSSDAGEVLIEPIEYQHNKFNFELIDSKINELNIKDNITVVMEATSIYHKAPWASRRYSRNRLYCHAPACQKQRRMQDIFPLSLPVSPASHEDYGLPRTPHNNCCEG